MALDVDNVKGELVIDPYRNKERYLSWDKRIPEISVRNEATIVSYLEDMRQGRNVNPRAIKGKRGYHRLMNQRHRLTMISRLFEQHEGITNIAPVAQPDIKKLERAASSLFAKMEDGQITRRNGTAPLLKLAVPTSTASFPRP